MSLSQPKLKNPCTKFIEWKGDVGHWQHWDKQSEKNVEIKNPKFIVLDELATISGYSEENKSRIYSNEVRSTKQPFNVRTFQGGVSFTGPYADIKGDIKALGGKYTQSVYAALVVGDGLELVNFQLKGVSFSAWIDYKGDKQLNGVMVNGATNGKKGKVEYKIPTFEETPISPELMEKAVGMDRDLQTYLKAYLKGNEVHESVQPDVKIEEDVEADPFN